MTDKWIIGNPDKKAVSELSVKGGISLPAAMALVSQGIDTIEKAAEFFRQNGGEDENKASPFASPFDISEMDTAVDIINNAVDNARSICIYGDYDCDGVTASAILYDYLSGIGADVSVHINERAQGFGMNSDVIRELHEKGTELIITVDNGISCVEEALLCRELGIDLIITDHHRPGVVIPQANAVVNPHLDSRETPFSNLCGCGVALKLICALEDGNMELAAERYSDLAAIATVADVVPLTGENREIVRQGLHYLENTENPGLRLLVEKAGLKAPYTARSVAFGIAPRINAAGRIGSPMDAFRMLTAVSPQEADELCEKVCSLNAQRKSLENAVMNDIYRAVGNDPSLLDRRVAVFSGKDWHHGVIGIAAARCTELFRLPAFLMSEEPDGSLRGSARSVGEFNVFDALSFCGDCLTKFGGHKGAGGFSLEAGRLDEFTCRLQQFAASLPAVPRNELNICGVITPDCLTVENVEGLNILEPFGEGCPRPLFMITGCTVEEIQPLSEGRHTRLMLKKDGISFTGLMFGTSPRMAGCVRGDAVNIIADPQINIYGGKKSVSLKVAGLRQSGVNQQRILCAEDTWHAFRRGDTLEDKVIASINPDRPALVKVYNAVRAYGGSVISIYSKVMNDVNLCKLLICLDIFEESGLIRFDRIAFTADIVSDAPKADVFSAPTAKKLAAYGVSTPL